MEMGQRLGCCCVAILFIFASIGGANGLSDGAALLAIKEKWGLNISSWAGDNPCNGWQGIKCDTDQRVISLNLSNTGVSGPVPEEIGTLDHLITLDLSNQKKSNGSWNQVTGDLSALSSLAKLENLNVTYNNLSVSSFPVAVLNLTNLVDLRIDNNFIGGPIPKELSRLSKLVYLYIGNNTMKGPLPPELGNLANLQELSVWKVNIESTLPPEFGNLANLTYLNAHDSNLYGGLPKEFGKLNKLQYLYLYSNSLTGEIPESWGNLTSVNKLYLHKNSLTKNIPLSVLQLPNLRNLSVGQNLLYGSLNLTGLKLPILTVTCNFFSGSEPTPPPTMTTFNDTGNCFTQSDTNDKIKCAQSPYYDCSTFLSQVPNGGCPLCPQLQVLQDPSTCVCTLGSTSGSNSHLVAKVVGSIAGVLVFLMLVCGGIWWIWFIRRKRRPTKEFWEGPDGVQHYLYHDLCIATENFSSKHEIGHGGFGKVFWGVVDGRTVAIKRAHTSSVQSSTGFRNEVMLLSRLHHRNLVRLLGFCEDNDIQILVYEYMPNGNLHDLLFKAKERKKLDWLRRLDIAIAVAQGLEYLHSFADPPVIHRDIKPSNVLLDENMVAKLSDFGISRVASAFETQFNTRPAGTVGYIDPQYILREQLTTASDVYSFGMVLLELVSGQKSIDNTRLDDHNLAEWAKIYMRKGNHRSIVDPLLGDNYPEEVYINMIRLAIDCTSFNSEDRPSTKVVVSILDGCRWSVTHLIDDMLEAPDNEKPDPNSNENYQEECHVKQNDNAYFESSGSTFEGNLLLPR